MPRPWPVEDIKGGSAFRIQGSKDDPGRLPPLVKRASSWYAGHGRNGSESAWQREEL